MYCHNCGSRLSENARFCPNCGEAVRSLPSKAAPAPSASGPSPVSVLIWGILGMAFATMGGLGFIGTIFSIIGLCKAGSYHAHGGAECKQATIGRSLSIAGLIVGIVMTIGFILYLFIMAGVFRRIMDMTFVPYDSFIDLRLITKL